jgi:hypothetical protein
VRNSCTEADTRTKRRSDQKTVARYQHATSQRDADLASRMTRTPIIRLAPDSTGARKGHADDAPESTQARKGHADETKQEPGAVGA